MYGGYYRIDISESLSVLAINSLYCNTNDDESKQANESDD